MRALVASEFESEKLLQELRAVLHEHSENLRKLAAEKLGKPE